MDTLSVYDALTFEQRDGYLYAGVRANSISVEESKAYLGSIADKCRAEGVSRLMIDRFVPEPISNTRGYLIISFFCDNFPADFKAAIVDPDERSHQCLDFGLHVAKPEGLDVRAFLTTDEAERWLLE